MALIMPHGREPVLPSPTPAMRHNPAYGILPESVQRRAVPVDRLEIGLGRRDQHEVGTRRINDAITPVRKSMPVALMSGSTWAR